jgi:hypothetical protein
MEKILSKKTLQMVALCVFFLFLAVYAFWGSHNLIFGVKIKDVNIVDGVKMTEGIIKITGNAKNAINLTLNGREITINENGDFNETIALLKGYNVVNITAKDKFGYVDEKNYQVINNERSEYILLDPVK